jgi:hypothetical protein
MNRVAFILAALVFMAPCVLAGEAESAKDKPVKVDAMDLRTPVPDPEKELTEKYDGRTVVFSGNLHSNGRDASSNQRWYNLAVQVIQEQSKPAAKPKLQLVTVNVYFAPQERRLPTRPASYTVQGTGEITVNGSLIIHHAKIVSVSPGKTASK